MRISFKIKLFISLIILFSLIFILFILYSSLEEEQRIYQEMGARARVQATFISAMPGLRSAVAENNIQKIKQFMAEVIPLSDASFIVIGDNKVNHLYHSVSEERVGTPLVGGDNHAVLQGKTVTTLRRGGLGVSLRSKAPLFDASGQVIGIVSVGYLKRELDTLTLRKILTSLMVFSSLLGLLFIFSWFFTRHIKKQIFSLEPREIGLLVRQQKAFLESIYEGVIAIDAQQNITLVNKAAQLLLGMDGPVETLLGRPIGQLITPVRFFDPSVMWYKDTHDELCHFNQLTVLASRVRIRFENRLQGWVITFRDRQEIDSLTARLSQVKGYLENLRIMHHEQLNQTAVISGLLQSARYQEAIAYIQLQSEQAQTVLDFISAHFHSPVLCGLLLGKVSHAREKGVELIFDPDSELQQPLQGITEGGLISVIGNLLDNAIEATSQRSWPRRPVEVLILGTPQDLIIEVADQGGGIPPDIARCIFDPGVTSKGSADHGLGLCLVHNIVTQAGGYIEISANPPAGSIFSVFIPQGDTPIVFPATHADCRYED